MKNPFRSSILAISLAGAFFLLAGSACADDNKSFADWPVGASPAEVGTRVAAHFAERKLDFEANPKRQNLIYPEACAWYGALEVAKLTGDTALRDKLIHKFDPLLAPENTARIAPTPHVDFRVIGIIPLEIYLQNKDAKYLTLGKSLADKQWENPTPDGITAEARYWVDDMFMITAIQTQAWRATGDKTYLDRVALTMAAYLDKLQRDNGLFHHAPDVPFFWSRGNGWFAVGMADLLAELPADHPKRARISQGYLKMMASLLQYQGNDGLWHQLIDHPESWSETSGTGMFAYAMVTGVRKGWLDAATYGPAARKAWLGLVSHLNKDAEISDVCEGTNKKNDLNYYLTRGRKTGDLHGQSPVMWTAAALMR